MRAAALFGGMPGVRWYRGYRPADRLGADVFELYKSRISPTEEEGNDRRLADWLSERGLDWDVWWTNDFRDEAQAFASLMAERGAQRVFDVDDLFTDLPSGNVARMSWVWKRRQRMKIAIEEADRVACSTPFLADKFGGVVAPNFVDKEDWDWPARPTRRQDECVLACPAGAGRSGDYLAKEGALRRFLELPNTKVVFFDAMPAWAREYPAGKVVWVRYLPYDVFNRMLCWVAPDIVMSPLEHNDFNMAKSNLKWLEAGACGACFVGERWGEYERTVKDGVDGILADGPAEWEERLVGLARDPEMRTRIAAAGRAAVYSKWTWPAVEAQWRKAVLGEEV